MTRTRSASFVGTPPDMADIDVEVFNSVCAGLIQDINLTHDKCTGSNGIAAASVIKHDGTAGGGSLLGFPLVNQQVNKLIAMTQADVTTYGGAVILWGAPVFVPAGEHARTWRMLIRCKGSAPDMSVSVLNSAGTSVQSNQMVRTTVPIDDFSGDDRFTSDVTFPTAGLHYITVTSEVKETTSFVLQSVHVVAMVSYYSNSTQNISTGGIQVGTAGAGIGVFHRLIHDEMVAANRPISSDLIRQIHSNLTSLYEYITASPVIGNASVTNTDTAATDPVTSRFMAHTASAYAAEGLIDFNLWSEGLGAVKTNGINTTNNAGTTGLFAGATTTDLEPSSDYFAPFVTTMTGAPFEVRNVVGFAPDFPAASVMKAAVLFASGAGAPTVGFNARINLEGGATTAAAAVTALSGVLFKSTPTNVAYTADSVNVWKLQISPGAVKGFVMNELNILGWCLYFDPP